MLSPQDVESFFADRDQLDLEDYALLDYTFKTAEDPRVVAASLCCEQSTAQWQRPGRSEDLRPQYGAKCLSLKPEASGSYQITVAHPHRNFGPRIPNFLSAAAGEGPYYCPGITSIRWTDFQLPDSFLKEFPGPQFGVAGLRAQFGIVDRPFFIGVVKPNIGLSPQDFAEVAYQSWCGGLDIAKDDEMLGDIDWSPLAERSRLAGEARQRAEQECGEKKLYIANLTDEFERLEEHYHLVTANGASSVMVNPIMMGFSALRALRRYATVPITSHFTGTAIFAHQPDCGISSLVTTKLQRLAGADIIVIAGFGERMHNTDAEVQANISACVESWGGLLPSLPVPGGSVTTESMQEIYQKVGHCDFGFICGRAVFAHPQGPAAGAQALRQAWQKIR